MMNSAQVEGYASSPHSFIIPHSSFIIFSVEDGGEVNLLALKRARRLRERQAAERGARAVHDRHLRLAPAAHGLDERAHLGVVAFLAPPARARARDALLDG